MTAIRRRLRLWAAAWLVFQAVSLSAFVPRACCLAHRPAVSATEHRCHENTAAIHEDHHDAGQNTSTRCSMRGMCEGPLAALFVVLSTPGVPAGGFEMFPDLRFGSAAIPAREHLITRLASPDPPPPRA
jgi:hypothetical protein